MVIQKVRLFGSFDISHDDATTQPFFSFIEKHFIFNVVKNELQPKRQCTVSMSYVRCPQEKPGEVEDCSYVYCKSKGALAQIPGEVQI